MHEKKKHNNGDKKKWKVNVVISKNYLFKLWAEKYMYLKTNAYVAIDFK